MGFVMEKFVRQKEEAEKLAAKEAIGIAFIRENRDGKPEVLLVKNGKTGKWYFPGGKVDYEQNEQKFEALKREVEEEIGISDLDLSQISYAKSGLYGGGRTRQNYFIHTYAMDGTNIDPQLQEGDSIVEFVWTDNPFAYDLTDQAKAVLKQGFYINDKFISFKE